jgi:hypothetical protein
MLEDAGRYAIRNKAEIQKNVFSDSDLEVMELIYKNFGNLDEFTLSQLSHEYPEWKKFEKSLEMGHSSRFEMNYQDFFEDSENSHFLFKQDREILELNKEIFLENQFISNLV